jgi:hypothetical protein
MDTRWTSCISLWYCSTQIWCLSIGTDHRWKSFISFDSWLSSYTFVRHNSLYRWYLVQTCFTSISRIVSNISFTIHRIAHHVHVDHMSSGVDPIVSLLLSLLFANGEFDERWFQRIGRREQQHESRIEGNRRQWSNTIEQQTKTWLIDVHLLDITIFFSSDVHCWQINRSVFIDCIHHEEEEKKTTN